MSFCVYQYLQIYIVLSCVQPTSEMKQPFTRVAFNISQSDSDRVLSPSAMYIAVLFRIPGESRVFLATSLVSFDVKFTYNDQLTEYLGIGRERSFASKIVGLKHPSRINCLFT